MATKVPLTDLNLSLCSLCGARCVWCPLQTRGTAMPEKMMSIELVKKIIDEVTSKEFLEAEHKIERIQLSENGDAFIHKDFFEIMRHIRSKMPDVKTIIHTNFHICDAEKSKIILEENLISEVHTSIDGMSPETYFAVKRLPLERVYKNITDFVRLRDEMNKTVPVVINTLSYRRYVEAVKERFSRLPFNTKGIENFDIKDDTEEVVKTVSEILTGSLDKIYVIKPMFWAERGLIDKDKVDYSSYTCPQLHRMFNQIFVAPNGTWYACCLDSNYQLKLGNLNENTILEVYNGPERNRFFDKIIQKRFKEIGHPCDTVGACYQ